MTAYAAIWVFMLGMSVGYWLGRRKEVSEVEAKFGSTLLRRRLEIAEGERDQAWKRQRALLAALAAQQELVRGLRGQEPFPPGAEKTRSHQP